MRKRKTQRKPTICDILKHMIPKFRRRDFIIRAAFIFGGALVAVTILGVFAGKVYGTYEVVSLLIEKGGEAAADAAGDL